MKREFCGRKSSSLEAVVNVIKLCAGNIIEIEYIERALFTHFKKTSNPIGIYRVLRCCALKNQNILKELNCARLTRDQ